MFLLAWKVCRISAVILVTALLIQMQTDLLVGDGPPGSSFFDLREEGVPSKDASHEPASLETFLAHSLLAIYC